MFVVKINIAFFSTDSGWHKTKTIVNLWRFQTRQNQTPVWREHGSVYNPEISARLWQKDENTQWIFLNLKYLHYLSSDISHLTKNTYLYEIWEFSVLYCVKNIYKYKKNYITDQKIVYSFFAYEICKIFVYFPYSEFICIFLMYNFL